MELERAQQWVGATLLLAIAGLGISVPMAYVSTLMVTRPELHSRAFGIWSMSIVVGVVALEGFWLLLGRRGISPWIPLGALPAAVAAFWLF